MCQILEISVKFPPSPPNCAILSIGSCRGALLCARLLTITPRSQIRRPPHRHTHRHSAHPDQLDQLDQLDHLDSLDHLDNLDHSDPPTSQPPNLQTSKPPNLPTSPTDNTRQHPTTTDNTTSVKPKRYGGGSTYHGFTKPPFKRTSKCKCGPDELPLLPP